MTRSESRSDKHTSHVVANTTQTQTSSQGEVDTTDSPANAGLPAGASQLPERSLPAQGKVDESPDGTGAGAGVEMNGNNAGAAACSEDDKKR